MSTRTPRTRRVRTRTLLLAGLAVSLLVAGVLSFYASGHPDGLEHVAEQERFLETAEDSAVADGPFADYATKGVDDERLSVGISGVLGTVVVLLLAGGLALLLRRRGARPAETGDETGHAGDGGRADDRSDAPSRA